MTVRHYAVLGWPVRHSVSPVMQNAAFTACGISAQYEALAVPPGHLLETFHRLQKLNYQGWNITVPHKQEALALLDQVDPDTRLGGSVNTVCHCNGQLTGYSTDGYGLVKALEDDFALTLSGARILLVGCGGAGRAVAVELARSGISQLLLLNRTPERAVALAALVQQINPACRVGTADLADPQQLEHFAATSDVLIQATSLGLNPDDPPPFPVTLVPPALAVMDMIYRPTAFLREAKARGCRTADGRDMLLHQGARSFTLWTGLPAPLEVMRKALYHALA